MIRYAFSASVRSGSPMLSKEVEKRTREHISLHLTHRIKGTLDCVFPSLISLSLSHLFSKLLERIADVLPFLTSVGFYIGSVKFV